MTQSEAAQAAGWRWPWQAGSGEAAPAIRRGRPEDVAEEARFDAAYAAAKAARAAASAQGQNAQSQHAQSQNAQAGSGRPPPPTYVQAERTALATGPAEDRAGPGAPLQPDGGQFFGEDGFGFGDFVDMINPLQHIPGVSTVYRELTGDEISPGARIAGGALYGGPVGAASAIANTVSEDVTGRDLAGAMMAGLTGGGDSAPALAPTSQTAAAASQVGALQTAAVPALQPAPQPAPQPVAQTMAQTGAETGAQTGAQTGASPIFAAQPPAVRSGGNIAPFAAVPTGSPMAAPAAATAARAAPAPAATPTAAAAQGVPTLSPEAATVLMRMSQQSQGVPAPAAAPAAQLAAPVSSAPVSSGPAAAAPAAPSAITPPPVQTAAASSATAPGYVAPVPKDNLPAAMMDALTRYETMKRGE
jgi:hypothetical protein